LSSARRRHATNVTSIERRRSTARHDARTLSPAAQPAYRTANSDVGKPARDVRYAPRVANSISRWLMHASALSCARERQNERYSPRGSPEWGHAANDSHRELPRLLGAIAKDSPFAPPAHDS
jgi:hypothetical protein